MFEWLERSKLLFCLLTDLPADIIADTFYGCRAADVLATPPFTIQCPRSTVINVQSALVGFSGSYQPPDTDKPAGSCPWTVKTSNTCSALGINCQLSTCNCNCTRPLPIPDFCLGQTASCTFQQSSLIFLNGPLCMLSRDAEFLAVNFTCNSREYSMWLVWLK